MKYTNRGESWQGWPSEGARGQHFSTSVAMQETVKVPSARATVPSARMSSEWVTMASLSYIGGFGGVKRVDGEPRPG